MIELLLLFIGASLMLYITLGGADYGAGIIEILRTPQKLKKIQTKTINQAMGPVWEVNHIWLILVIVILFMGFPPVFKILMISLHIPMVAILFGIVIRGCSFAFRHYDPQITERSAYIYTRIFGYSSLWTSYWLGVTVASLHRGLISEDVTGLSFYDAYIAPWTGFYPVATGIFVISLFIFLASAYLIAETDQPDLLEHYNQRAKKLNNITIMLSVIVFISSLLEERPLIFEFFIRPVALIPIILATIFYFLLRDAIVRKNIFKIRLYSGLQVSLILVGWYVIYSPNAIATLSGEISFFESAAPDATLKQLIIALLVGSTLIFPTLCYLIKVFKVK